jgi:hypothetical protein
MRFDPTIVNGIADYVVGAIVLGLPFFYGWTGVPWATLTALGAIVIACSLVTDYEGGLIGFLRIRFICCSTRSLGWRCFYFRRCWSLATTRIRAQGTHSHASL